MTQIETREQAREQATVHHTGGWYIAELDNPALVVQGESEADAREKIAKRWEEYTTEPDQPDRLPETIPPEPEINSPFHE